MSETIKLVADAISEVKATMVKDPSIFIALKTCTNVDNKTNF